MSNIDPKAKIYAVLADSVYWDVRYGQRKDGSLDQVNSNWTPVPSDWKLIKEESHSGQDFPNFNGFTARAYQNGNEIVIAFAGTDPPTEKSLQKSLKSHSNHLAWLTMADLI